MINSIEIELTAVGNAPQLHVNTTVPQCQFALNRDPYFASNSDPVMRGVR